MLSKRLIKSNDAGGGACTNTVDLYNPFPDGGGVALYQLNGDATDESGNYDGTASNVTYGTGQFGQAGVFNGNSNSYIFLSSLNSFFLNGGNAQNFSVSLWFKTVNTGIFFSDFQGGYKAIISLNASGNLYVGTRAVAGDFDYATTETYNDGQWHHVAVTISKDSSNNKKVYIDNILKNTSTIPYADGQYVSTGYGNNVSLATFAANGTTYGGHNCSIDQVRIFNRVLRPYEVEALYTEEYCTPTIVPSEHFNTVLYSGNGTSQSVTGVGFQPDFTWIKDRTTTDNNVLQDSVRGVGKGLFSDLTNAENSSMGGMTSFDSDGFTFDGSISTLNGNGRNFVAWNFKAGGAAVTNTDGTITSQVSANTEAGFSVVSYTGSGANATIGHGLSDAPNVIIVKGRNTTYDWVVYNSNLGATKYQTLNTTIAANSVSNVWNDTEPTPSVFSVGSNLATNQSSDPKIAYCFAEVEGFSNFGSYVGTGASGNTIVTGFEPAFIMVKSSSLARNWHIFDNKRTSGQQHYYLDPNVSNAEVTSFDAIRFLENGFEFVQGDDQFNGSGGSYIYMAFAADPTAVEPSLEDSFNTVLYTSTGGSQSITGVGFQPDLLWTKNRTSTWFHQIVDSVRLAPNTIYSNSTQAESTPVSYTSSLDTDGFTVNYTETIGSNYVAWAWKAAEIPAINSDGSIPSVVSANPAAGFSIVSYTGTGNNTPITVGHGLGEDVIPAFIIVKYRGGYNWYAYHKEAGTNNYFEFNTTAAVAFSSVVFGTQTNGTIRLGGDYVVSRDTGNYIAYCFAEVAGFSKFGSYTGNGTTQTIVTGFEPAFVMLKRTDVSGYPWAMADNKRTDGELLANVSDAERNENTPDFISNGFTMTTSRYNDTGEEWIYMAFANQF